MFEFYKIDRKKQIVGGIIYQPDTVDSQGDKATAEEIEKARDRFMVRYFKDTAIFKISHQGPKYTFPILESFIPESDITKGGKTVKAGAWWIMLKIPDKKIWKLIEEGKLNGLSMGGRASAA